ncbi:ANTAR domain-containing protein [Geodermatophilaceae bacterium NBWT11]|nr:ANTAR domain-containing protein [Geodermatophilaceae bacterium NBWT11]
MTRPAPVHDGLAEPTAFDDSTILGALHDLLVAAAQGAPGVLSCVLTLVSPQGEVAVSSADPLGRAARLTDDDLGAGPGLQCARDGDVVLVGDTAAQGPWGAAAERSGVRSSSSYPLAVDAGTRGAVTFLCAEPRTPVDPVHAAHTAGRVAGLLTAAARLAEHDDQIAQLGRALESRTVIGQAAGLLMAQTRCRSDTAMDALKRQSQHANRKVRDIAVELVQAHEDAVSRAVAAAAPAPAELTPAASPAVEAVPPAEAQDETARTPARPREAARTAPVDPGVLVLHRGGPHAGRVRRVPAEMSRQALVYERDLAVYRPEVPPRLLPTPEGPAQVWVCT